MNLHSEPTVVIGMQRSGTSAVSGALQRLGVCFGSKEMLYPADANNPTGFFEHRKATVLNLQCLETFGMHPTTFESMPPDWKAHPLAASLRSNLKDFLREEFSGKGRWGIKQPLSTLTLPLYRDVFEELGVRPHFVLCVRNPLENMLSESKLDFGGAYRVMAPLGSMAIGSWLRYTLGGFGDSDGSPLTVVGYDDFLEAPISSLIRIVEKHDDWKVATIDFEAAAATVRRELQHHRASVEELDLYPRIVRETLETALRFNEHPYTCGQELAGLLQEFEGWVAVTRAPIQAHGKLGLAWLAAGGPAVAETPYRVTGSWQTVRVTVEAPPNTVVSGLIYGLPCRVWIKRCVWKTVSKESEAAISTGLCSVLSQVDDVTLLDAVFEPEQMSFTTPSRAGPYELEIEFLIEQGPSIAAKAAERLAKNLGECTDRFESVRQRLHQQVPRSFP
jgi:hypothetical protein